jgi:serine/threonine protein kinase
VTPIVRDTIIADRYRLVERLGEGSMGSVWRAEHVTLGSEVAIKLLDESIARHSTALARFLREARSAASLQSVHVVQIHDYGVVDEVPYIAMELLRGETLGNRLRRLGRLTPQDTAWILTHVARAIGKAHEAGVIHRDLKPDNIFIVREDDEEFAKVLDFGVAKAGEGVFAATLTSAGTLLGTPAYMSAEQAVGQPVDHRTDLWALAVIAFECLTGTLPFFGDDLPDLLHAIHDGPIPIPSRMGRVPLEFDAWFARGVARRLDDRFRSARQMANELRRICAADTGDADGRATLIGPRRDRGAKEDDGDEETETTAARIASALGPPASPDEDDLSSSNAFDDIIRTQDILRDAAARPSDDILTDADFDDDPGEASATPVVLAAAATPAVRARPVRSATPPPKPVSPKSRPHAAPAPGAAADGLVPVPATPGWLPSAPPVSERMSAEATAVMSVVPRRSNSTTFLVSTGAVVVLTTLGAMVVYAFGGDAPGTEPADPRWAGAAVPSAAPSVDPSSSAPTRTATVAPQAMPTPGSAQ